MKWYFAINESGTRNDAGALARLAVLSARQQTTLEPHMLYRGERSEFTDWMERQGVRIIDVVPRYERSLQRAISEGWYPSGWTGHWLRTEICLLEHQEEFVLYTDVDVIFLKPIELGNFRPRFFACAPEMNMQERDHFNSGVMLMNVPALRADYPRLHAAIEARFHSGERKPFHDQTIYNLVYQGLHDHLDPIYNWKPYWPPNPDAVILHFHGPKFEVIEALIAGTWRLDSEYSLMAARLLGANLTRYVPYLELMHQLSSHDDLLRARLSAMIDKIPSALPDIQALLRDYDRQVESTKHSISNIGPAQATTKPNVAQEFIWRKAGESVWDLQDRRAFVCLDPTSAKSIYLGALRWPVTQQLSPQFVTDRLGRVQRFATADDAKAACEHLIGARAEAFN